MTRQQVRDALQRALEALVKAQEAAQRLAVLEAEIAARHEPPPAL